MRRTIVGLGLVGFVALVSAATVWFLSRSDFKQESHGAVRGFCATCGKRVWTENAPCPNCGSRTDAPRTASSGATTPETAALKPVKPGTKLAIALALVVALLIALNVQQLRRLLHRRPAPDGFMVVRCEECRCKLRYLAANAGSIGLCPRCGNKVAFPETASAAPLRW